MPELFERDRVKVFSYDLESGCTDQVCDLVAHRVENRCGPADSFGRRAQYPVVEVTDDNVVEDVPQTKPNDQEELGRGNGRPLGSLYFASG